MATQLNTPDLFEAARSLGVAISPSTPTIGAEISGLDLDRPL
ncbi:MAG: TauD/TfdA family dioxygenase, partial [Cytophagaceae bacterium]